MHQRFLLAMLVALALPAAADQVITATPVREAAQPEKKEDEKKPAPQHEPPPPLPPIAEERVAGRERAAMMPSEDASGRRVCPDGSAPGLA